MFAAFSRWLRAEQYERVVTVKAFLLAGLIVMVCLYVSVKPVKPPIALASSAARRFQVKIEQILPAGSARANGGYWDLSPTENERDLDDQHAKWVKLGEIIIRNPPAGAHVGQTLDVWLEPQGGAQAKPDNKLSVLMRAYDVVETPVTPAPNHMSWMHKADPYWK